MKSTKILIISCAVIYSALFSLLGLFICQYKNNKVESRAESGVEYIEISLEEAEGNSEENAGITFKSIEDIQPTSQSIDTSVIGNEYIASRIIHWAELYDFEPNSAFLLVHVESDFNEKAQNKNSFATGLCQITEVCLNEFNKKNQKEYTMADMLIADKNLEVGFWYFAELLNDDKYGVKYGIYTMKDAYIAYNCGPKYFREHKSELYDGYYKGCTYNAGNRWDSLADYWT